ncbi:hypothetical protein PC118_g24200 [Phytophthora cactorum]|uniref:Integrase catalytic domain-containing protein n=1 Tax=Phytophthora cactorum TaxID=29920 RepID=A0A8T1AC70_9STRA|nr:hypothetical protein PC115_g24082 [Phytophthora cactorum]KAG2957052.1 hypothetical protein PC118_g24200 [Phytophthora cactorum]
MRLDFVFGLPADDHGNTGILVFVCRLSKMVHLAPVPDTITGEQTARLFVDGVFRHHGLPETFVSDRDPRFTAAFWQTLFQLLGTRLHIVCAAAPRTWSERLPVVEFAFNNAVHASTGFTPFYLNGMRHPRVPLALRGGTESSILSVGGEARKALSSQVSDLRPVSLRKKVESFIDTRLNVINRVRDAMAIAQDRQKEYSDKHGRGNVNVFKVGDFVLLDTRNLPLATVSSVGSNKLKHRFIGPFAVLARHGASYTIDLPKSMKTHPTFYVGRLKRYHDPQGPAAPQTPQASREEEDPTPRNENQPQTSSNVQRRKAKTHAALVDREASGTPEGLRTVEPQLVRLRPRCQVTKRTPDLLKLTESLIHIRRWRPATNPIMESRNLPVQLVQAILGLREDPAIPGLGGSITASPETQSDLEDKNALTETINLRVLRLSHSRKQCTQP